MKPVNQRNISREDVQGSGKRKKLFYVFPFCFFGPPHTPSSSSAEMAENSKGVRGRGEEEDNVAGGIMSRLWKN